MPIDHQDHNQERKVRVLIGVFDTIDGLSCAMDDLAASGVDRSDMMLVADPGGLDGHLEARFPAFGSVADQKGPAVLIRLLGAEIPLALAPGHRSNTMRLAAGRVLQFEGWFASGLSQNLDGHLRSGASLLVIPIKTAREEREYSETMLNHSIDTVQLHDLMAPN